MKLKDLTVKLSDNYLNFECPECKDVEAKIETYHHTVVIPVTRDKEIFNKSNRVWLIEGDLDNLTVTPSILSKTHHIKHKCQLHIWIKNGEIVQA